MKRIWNKHKINTPLKPKVFVAMSGGVDSSVAALLLKQKGYDVIGVFMKYWMDNTSGAENRCCSLEARRDAMKVCAHLGIPFLTWDFQKEFKKSVVDDFVSGYKKGITPNPCVACNKNIKLGLFLKKALKEGADFVATGHYARLRREFPISIRQLADQFPNRNKNSKSQIIYKLCQAKDVKKDQSYFLYNLKQEQLAHILFPLGNLIKDEVRKIAAEAGIPVALKKDSQEVCFVKDGNLKEFLKENMQMKKGDILHDNIKIGEHEGAQFYTIGQRAPIGGTGPYYVIGKNIKKNQLIVARGKDEELFVKEISVKNVNWISGKTPKLPFECQVKTRYQQQSQKAAIKKIKLPNSNFQLLFKKSQRAITPGQSAVFYKGKEIIGGGIIC